MTALKIATVGNCQSDMMKYCISLLSGAKVEWIPFWTIQSDYETEGKLKERLSPFDLVLTQRYEPSGFGPLGSDAITRVSNRSIHVPNIYFQAFHPDVIYAESAGEDGAVSSLSSPVGAYHSSIAILGFKLGFSVEKTMSLFQSRFLDVLGYLRLWESNQELYYQQCDEINFPGEGIFLNWTRRGNFLHTPNHPKIFVLDDIARLALSINSIECRNIRSEDYIHDGLLDIIWPVYPDVAKLFGIDGNYLFKPAASLVSGISDRVTTLDLEEFVGKSFKIYEEVGSKNIRASRVDDFFEDATIRDAASNL